MMTAEDIDRILSADAAPSRPARRVGAELDERAAILTAARILRQNHPLDAEACACAQKLEGLAENRMQPGEALLFVDLSGLS